MKTLLYAIAMSTAAVLAGCTTPTAGVPGTKNLTVAVDANCAGIVNSVHVIVQKADFGDITPGYSITKALAPAIYPITADGDKNGKHWATSVTLTSDQTFNCGCP